MVDKGIVWLLTFCLQIAKAVHEEVITRDMVPAFVKLLKDTEAEVRTAIAGQIPGISPNLDFDMAVTNKTPFRIL